MKEYAGLKFSATQAARIIGANSLSIISVWTNRGLIIPSDVITYSAKKKVFEFSYFNLFQAAILKELGDYFLNQYEFLNKVKGVDKGLGSKKLEQAARMGKGFLVITDKVQRRAEEEVGNNPKAVNNIAVELVENQEAAVRQISGTGYALILNIAEIAKRLERGIAEEVKM